MSRPRLEVDRYSTTSRPYQQIADQIRAYVTSGEVAPYDLLWSSSDISQETGVAINTARHALRVLQEEGLVLIVPGLGNVVAPR